MLNCLCHFLVSDTLQRQQDAKALECAGLRARGWEKEEKGKITSEITKVQGRLDDSVVEHLPLAQGMMGDRVPHGAPCSASLSVSHE